MEQQGSQKVPTWSQKGSKMGAEIGAKSEKDGKIEVQKSMPKKCAFLETSGYQPDSNQGRFWSQRGGKEGICPSGNRRNRIEPLRSENALHPAGCDGFFIKNATLGETGSIDSLTLSDY